VLPVLLAELGASDALVGFAQLIQTLGFTLPALLAAHYIHGRANHKSFLLTTCAIGRAGMLTLPPVILLLGRDAPGLALVWLYVVIAVFWLMDGGCAVSWFDIIAKTIPPRVRGRFFGVMQLASGVAAAVAGLIVKAILESPAIPFPTDFALLLGCWCVGLALSQLCLWLIREPAGFVDTESKPRFIDFVRQTGPLLRRHVQLRRLILARLLIDGATLAAPFYALFARRDLHVPASAIGTYLVWLSVGKIAAGPLWGWISDRFGPVVALRCVAGVVSLAPLIALSSGAGSSWVFPAVFLMRGAVQDGLWMVGSNAMLDAVGETERPLAVGVASMLLAPTALYGVLGGLLAERTTYSVVFACALSLAVMGLLCTLTLLKARSQNRSEVGSGDAGVD
jgi:hypothetical protein